MGANETDETSRGRFDDVADRLTNERAGVQRVKMFGKSCLAVHGKGFAAFTGDGLALKLTGEPHGRALGLPGARLWDPSGRGRPMREWVLVPAAHAAEWDALADAACAYIGGA